jgi:hypothetical protein
VELGLPEGRNYTEATGKSELPLYIAESYNNSYLFFPKLFVLYCNTMKGKHWIVGRKVT